MTKQQDTLFRKQWYFLFYHDTKYIQARCILVSPWVFFRLHQAKNKRPMFQYFRPLLLEEIPRSLSLLQGELPHQAVYITQLQWEIPSQFLSRHISPWFRLYSPQFYQYFELFRCLLQNCTIFVDR